MDQIELDVLETDLKSNKYYLFVKKVTLQFLLPVSLVSFLLSYTSGFSFFYLYKYHLSAFVFPLLTHVFERKYTFLLCNGILAFLAKSISFSSSSYDVSDKNGKILEGSDSDGKIKETSEAQQEEGKGSQHAELETEVEQGEQKAEAADEKEAEDER